MIAALVLAVSIAVADVFVPWLTPAMWALSASLVVQDATTLVRSSARVHRGPHLTSTGYKVVAVRAGVVLAVMVLSLLLDSRAVALGPAAFALVSLCARRCASGGHFPGSWLRRAAHVVADALTNDVRQGAASRAFITTAFAVLLPTVTGMHLLGNPLLAEMPRDLFDAAARDGGFDRVADQFDQILPRRGRGDERPAPTDSSGGRTLSGPTDAADHKARARSLVEICGTDRLSAIGVAGAIRDLLEQAWHELGAIQSGCPAGRVDELANGGAVVWLAGGSSDPAALVNSPFEASAFVREDAIPYMSALLSRGKLSGVEQYRAGVSSSIQLFHTTRGCQARVYSHGRGRHQFDEELTAEVFRMLEEAAGQLDHVVVTILNGEQSLTVAATTAGQPFNFELAVELRGEAGVETWHLRERRGHPAALVPCPRDSIEQGLLLQSPS